jgi:hypothetical protein
VKRHVYAALRGAIFYTQGSLSLKARLAQAIVLGALAFSITLAAHASTLYNNLTATSSGSNSLAGLDHLADSFSTGSSPIVLGSVTLDLSADNPSDGGSFTVTLDSDHATSPGSVLASLAVFGDSALTTSLADYTLSLDVPLSANTRYWIQLASANSSADWSYSYNISGPGVAGQYFANLGVFPNSQGPYQMDVETVPAATPEPSSLLLLGSGLMMLADPLRRRLCAGLRG